MKRAFGIACLGLFLAACGGPKISQEGFESQQVYQGYPCLDNCSEFKAGYDTASQHKITDPDKCTGSTISEVTGCKAFAADYTFENRSYQEVMDDFGLH